MQVLHQTVSTVISAVYNTGNVWSTL